jgi:hypothetical protein
MGNIESVQHQQYDDHLGSPSALCSCKKERVRSENQSSGGPGFGIAGCPSQSVPRIWDGVPGGDLEVSIARQWDLQLLVRSLFLFLLH